jgi:uncharacterized protein (DUF2141 family)
MTHTKPFLALSLAGIAALSAAAAGAAEPAHRLDVTVRGLRSADGAVAIALFDEGARFDEREGAIRKAYLTIAGGEAHWSVEGLPPGDYALLAYHDENGNGELDFRPLGIPKEPIAVSNGAKRLLGPPRFESAKFAVDSATSSVTLELN